MKFLRWISLYSEVFQVNLRRLPFIKEEFFQDFFGENFGLTLDYSCLLSRKPSMMQRKNIYRLSIDLSSSGVDLEPSEETANALTANGEKFNFMFDELLKVGYNQKVPGLKLSTRCNHYKYVD